MPWTFSSSVQMGVGLSSMDLEFSASHLAHRKALQLALFQATVAVTIKCRHASIFSQSETLLRGCILEWLHLFCMYLPLYGFSSPKRYMPGGFFAFQCMSCEDLGEPRGYRDVNAILT